MELSNQGGRPTRQAELQRDLQESALFEIGEGRAFLADLLTLSRQLEQILKAQAASTERARLALDEELKDEVRLKVFAENVKRLASVRLQELRLEQDHLVKIAAQLGIDKVRPLTDLKVLTSPTS